MKSDSFGASAAFPASTEDRMMNSDRSFARKIVARLLSRNPFLETVRSDRAVLKEVSRAMCVIPLRDRGKATARVRLLSFLTVYVARPERVALLFRHKGRFVSSATSWADELRDENNFQGNRTPKIRRRHE